MITLNLNFKKSELNEELSNKTLSVLEKCEYVRFSQNKGAELYNELFLQTEELITEIENNMLLIKKQKRNTQKLFNDYLIFFNDYFIFSSR